MSKYFYARVNNKIVVTYNSFKRGNKSKDLHKCIMHLYKITQCYSGGRINIKTSEAKLKKKGNINFT